MSTKKEISDSKKKTVNPLKPQSINPFRGNVFTGNKPPKQVFKRKVFKTQHKG